MLWDCQPVADCRSSIVAPLERVRRARHAFCFVGRCDGPLRGTGAAGIMFARVDTGVRWLRVTRAAVGFDDGFALGGAVLDVRDLAMWRGSGCLRRRNWRSHHPEPRERRGELCAFGAFTGADHTCSNAWFPAKVEWKGAGRRLKNRTGALATDLLWGPTTARLYPIEPLKRHRFCGAYPSHGRDHRFNPYTAHN